jgi:hypothetical protein
VQQSPHWDFYRSEQTREEPYRKVSFKRPWWSVGLDQLINYSGVGYELVRDWCLYMHVWISVMTHGQEYRRVSLCRYMTPISGQMPSYAKQYPARFDTGILISFAQVLVKIRAMLECTVIRSESINQGLEPPQVCDFPLSRFNMPATRLILWHSDIYAN